MDWNQPQPSSPVGPHNMQAPVVPGAPIPQPPMQAPNITGPASGQTGAMPAGYASGSPLQVPLPPTPSVPPMAQSASGMPMSPQPAFSSPLQSPAINPVAAGQPALNAPSVPLSNSDDSKDVSVDDAVWIARTKRAIAESKGDPHRQAQLIQHLRSEYLKQRYGRTVHTDEG